MNNLLQFKDFLQPIVLTGGKYLLVVIIYIYLFWMTPVAVAEELSFHFDFTRDGKGWRGSILEPDPYIVEDEASTTKKVKCIVVAHLFAIPFVFLVWIAF